MPIVQRHAEQVVALVVVVALTGCDDGIDTYPAFTEAYAERACDQMHRCDLGYASSATWRALVPVELCARIEAAGERSRELDEDLANGTQVYDAEAGAACLASFDAPCAGGHVSACRRVLVGTVPDGGPCTSFDQCASRRCSGTVLACGACEPAAADGETCAVREECGVDSVCELGRCTRAPLALEIAQVGLGDSCAVDDDGTYQVCAPGLFCDADDARCAERHRLGEPCDGEADDCEPATLCAADEAGDERCLAIVIVEDVGADCGFVDDAFVFCDPSAQLACEAGACVRLAGDGGVGSECLEPEFCDSGLCASLGGERDVCVAGDLPDGAPCEALEECASRFCSPFTDRCEPRRVTCP